MAEATCYPCRSRNTCCTGPQKCILNIYFSKPSDISKYDTLVAHFGTVQVFKDKIEEIHTKEGPAAVRVWISGIISVCDKLNVEILRLNDTINTKDAQILDLELKVQKLEKDLLLAKGTFYWYIQKLEKDGGLEGSGDGPSIFGDGEADAVVGQVTVDGQELFDVDEQQEEDAAGGFIVSWEDHGRRSLRRRRLVFDRLVPFVYVDISDGCDSEFDESTESVESCSEYEPDSDLADSSDAESVASDDLDLFGLFDAEVAGSDVDAPVAAEVAGSDVDVPVAVLRRSDRLRRV